MTVSQAPAGFRTIISSAMAACIVVSPGHGVTIGEQLAAKYPYSPKQLPIARLEDGSMWDW